MIDNLLEFVVGIIILAAGAGITLVMLGADPQLATALISGVVELAVLILVVGIILILILGPLMMVDS